MNEEKTYLEVDLRVEFTLDNNTKHALLIKDFCWEDFVEFDKEGGIIESSYWDAVQILIDDLLIPFKDYNDAIEEQQKVIDKINETYSNNIVVSIDKVESKLYEACTSK